MCGKCASSQSCLSDSDCNSQRCASGVCVSCFDSFQSDGEIVIRPIMQLALSYDHRQVDGRDAVLFLKTIKDLLEDPLRLLLQI